MIPLVRKVLLVDALGEGPFSGAPAVVVFLESPLDKFKMVSLAHELAPGEIVFVLAHRQAHLLRFFNATQEVPLGGHACHAAAHLIWELGLTPPGAPLSLMTQEGRLEARRLEPDLVEVAFPAQNLAKMDQSAMDQCASIAGLGPGDLAWGALTPTRQAVLAVDQRVQLKRLEPDRTRLAKSGFSALAITRSEPQEGEYSLRSFGANPLRPEQHASVNLHRSLAPHWGRLLQKRRLRARQLSSRGSLVQLDVSAPGRVLATGRCRTVLRSDLVLELMDDVPVTVLGARDR